MTADKDEFDDSAILPGLGDPSLPKADRGLGFSEPRLLLT